MNKKANIPVTILVIGTIALFIVALIVFDNENKNEERDLELFKILSIMEGVREKIEMGMTLEEVKGEYDSGRSYRRIVKGIVEEGGMFVYRKIEKEGALFWKKEKVTFEVKF